jgi:hypothetical protein
VFAELRVVPHEELPLSYLSGQAYRWVSPPNPDGRIFVEGVLSNQVVWLSESNGNCDVSEPGIAIPVAFCSQMNNDHMRFKNRQWYFSQMQGRKQIFFPTFFSSSSY